MYYVCTWEPPGSAEGLESEFCPGGLKPNTGMATRTEHLKHYSMYTVLLCM